MENRGTLECRSIEGDYGHPTFRFCMVCNRFKSMEYGEADKVRASVGKEWDTIKANLMSATSEFALNHIQVKDTKEKPDEDYFEGPAVKFPEFVAELPCNMIAKIGTSITVCVKPHHSKIWVRFSHEGNGMKNSLMDLGRFYSEARVASKLIAQELLSKYQECLRNHDMNESLEKAHEISIETMSKDLEDIADLFEEDSFSMSAILREDRHFRILSGFLNTTYDKDISGIEELKSLPDNLENLEWFKMEVSKPSFGEFVGVYSKHHSPGETKFVGLVQEPAKVNSDCHVTKEFSKILVQHIAPAF